MRAGPLRHRLIIEAFSGAQDTLGNVNAKDDSNYSTVDTVWGSVSPTTGSERFSNSQQLADVTHTITIRSYSALTAKHRIKFGSRKFGILQILDKDERGIMMMILAKEAL